MLDWLPVRAACILAACSSCLFIAGLSLTTSDCQSCRLVVPRRVARRLPRSAIEGQRERIWDRNAGDYFALCLILKDQHRDVREWVAHHHAIGASTIYVHDHRSQPPLRDLLTDFIEAGVVEYKWWNRSWDNYNYSTHVNPQMDVYGSCLRHYGIRHQFIGFLDSDEFLILKDKAIPSVPHLLRAMMRRQEIGGLAVHWRVFGSSGHVTAPEAGVLQAFTSCTPEGHYMNEVVKTLANTNYAVRNFGHIVELNSSSVAVVKENFQVVNASRCPPVVQNKIVVHHYMIKSLEEFQQKRSRGGGSGRKRKMPWFYTINNASVETCLDADRYQALQ